MSETLTRPEYVAIKAINLGGRIRYEADYLHFTHEGEITDSARLIVESPETVMVLISRRNSKGKPLGLEEVANLSTSLWYDGITPLQAVELIN